MKKSLIALAVLAASGASFAQSSVTVYGIADVWFGTTSETNKPSQTVLQSGGVSGSRWGLKGTEDLGSGLKANFLLEQGFNLDNGAAGNSTKQFNRQSYVGFSGGFGEVKLGNVFTAYDDISGAANSAFDSALSAQNGVWASINYNSNPYNNIYYVSPNLNGFTAAVSYAVGENKTATVAASNVTSLNVQYAAGPLFVGLGYQVEKAQTPTPAAAYVTAVDIPDTLFVAGDVVPAVVATGTEDTKFTRLNGTYDFGAAKLLAGYGRVAVGDAATTEWELGADVPVSAALTLSGGIARSSDNAAAGDASRKGYGVAAAYALSKRTTVYGGFHSHTITPAAGEETTARVTAVGVKHTF